MNPDATHRGVVESPLQGLFMTPPPLGRPQEGNSQSDDEGLVLWR